MPKSLKFDTHIGYNYLYCARQNRRSHVYHCLYLSIFLFLRYFFLSKISQELLHLEIKNGTNIGYGKLYCVRENEHTHA